MAKLYDFRIVVRRAEFKSGAIVIPYGGSGDVYCEECIHTTFAGAVARRKELSDAESRPHGAFLTMKYREDRKPPGFDKAYVIYKER